MNRSSKYSSNSFSCDTAVSATRGAAHGFACPARRASQRKPSRTWQRLHPAFFLLCVLFVNIVMAAVRAGEGSSGRRGERAGTRAATDSGSGPAAAAAAASGSALRSRDCHTQTTLDIRSHASNVRTRDLKIGNLRTTMGAGGACHARQGCYFPHAFFYRFFLQMHLAKFGEVLLVRFWQCRYRVDGRTGDGASAAQYVQAGVCAAAAAVPEDAAASALGKMERRGKRHGGRC